MSSFNEIIEYVKDDLIIVKKNIEELSEKESGYSEEISKETIVRSFFSRKTA